MTAVPWVVRCNWERRTSPGAQLARAELAASRMPQRHGDAASSPAAAPPPAYTRATPLLAAGCAYAGGTALPSAAAALGAASPAGAGTAAKGAGGDDDDAPPPPTAAAAAGLRWILMCSNDSISMRQTGHLLDCVFRALAHSWHMHMCRQGSTVVSRSLLRQITHSRPSGSSATGVPVATLFCSMP